MYFERGWTYQVIILIIAIWELGRLNKGRHIFRFNPSVYLSYKLNAQSDLRVQGAYTEGVGALTDLLTSAVQNNIISASIGSGMLAQNKTLHLSTDYRFRLPTRDVVFQYGGHLYLPA